MTAAITRDHRVMAAVGETLIRAGGQAGESAIPPSGQPLGGLISVYPTPATGEPPMLPVTATSPSQ